MDLNRIEQPGRAGMDFENCQGWDWGLSDVRLREIVLSSAAGPWGSLLKADSHAHPCDPQGPAFPPLLSGLRALTLACTHTLYAAI